MAAPSPTSTRAGPALVLIPETGQDIASLGTLASILVEEDFRSPRST
jgi:hypothetical protein